MFTPADEEPSLFITVQNVLWHAYLVIVEAHLTGLQMLTSGDENISCSPELLLLASHIITS